MTHGINFQQVKNSLPIAIASTAKIVSVLIPKESFVITPLTKSEKLNSLRFLTCVCLIETTTSQNRFVARNGMQIARVMFFLKINTRGWSNPRNMYMSDYQIPVRRVGTAIVISGNRQGERKFEQTVIERALPSKRWVWKYACSVTTRCEQWTSLIHHTDTPFTELITPQEQNINTWSGSSLATLEVHPRPNGGEI